MKTFCFWSSRLLLASLLLVGVMAAVKDRPIVTEYFGPASTTFDVKKPTKIKRKDAKPVEPPAPPDDPVVLHGYDVITNLMVVLNWKGPATRYDGPEDKFYIQPTSADIKDFLTYYKFRKENGYVPDSFDCDDFAREFLHLSRVWSKRYYDGVPASVLTAAVYVRIVKKYGNLSPGGLHVLNLICRNDGVWFLVEPQDQTMSLVSETGHIFEVIKVQF